MMTALTLLSWCGAGFALALFFLFMQQWTVNHISPDNQKQGKWLVIGGAVIRWISFSLLAILALQHSHAAVLAVFFTFMSARMLLLVLISRTFSAKPNTTT